MSSHRVALNIKDAGADRLVRELAAETQSGSGIAVVQIAPDRLYTRAMDVAISALRAELSSWIERAHAGEEIVVTDRGTPVARLLPVDTAPLLEQLVRRGVLSRPVRAERPPARSASRAHARGPVADLVSEQRR